jgi:FkbM family methyltransferase
MNFEQRIRSFARQTMPEALRRPLGTVCGRLRSHVLYPALGLIFDLGGDRFSADGCTFVIPRNITSLELRASFLLRSYEADERQLVRKFFLPEDSVLELGACLGIIACITNKLLLDPTRHVVVEANPHCLPAIHRNRARNQASFLVEHCAVSNEKEVIFSIDPQHITGSSIGNRSGISVRLPGRSLNELVERHGPFSALIVDIEGSELELLESSASTLRTFRLVIIELHETIIGVKGIDRCHSSLQAAGFVLKEKSYITEAWLNASFTDKPAA